MQGSIKNNLSGGLSVSSDKISNLLKDFFLDEFMKTLPMGLGTVVSPMAAALPIQIKKKLLISSMSLSLEGWQRISRKHFHHYRKKNLNSL